MLVLIMFIPTHDKYNHADFMKPATPYKYAYMCVYH